MGCGCANCNMTDDVTMAAECGFSQEEPLSSPDEDTDNHCQVRSISLLMLSIQAKKVHLRSNYIEVSVMLQYNDH